MPRFVILEHDHPTLHWDFMLEADGVLRTWRLPSPPAVGDDIRVEAIADHRLAYLDYEGPVSGGRGAVSRWDFGAFAVEESADDFVAATLVGVRLQGRFELRRIDGNVWTLTWMVKPV